MLSGCNDGEKAARVAVRSMWEVFVQNAETVTSDILTPALQSAAPAEAWIPGKHHRCAEVPEAKVSTLTGRAGAKRANASVHVHEVKQTLCLL